MVVGYRFSPWAEELINHYLKNKILGKTWLVDEAISEIKICSYEPKFLPTLSKIKSDDPVWYFFSRIEYANENMTAMKRKTGSGYWKPTGKDRKIRDKRGNGVEIGLKKTLVYHEGRFPNGVRTPWVMHEYHITYLPQDQRKYVICQVMYKGEYGDIPSGGNYSSEPSQSWVSDSNTARAMYTVPEVEQLGGENVFGMSVDDLTNQVNEQEDLSQWYACCNPNTLLSDDINNPYVQPQTPDDDDDYINELLSYNGGNFEDVLSDQVHIMKADRITHRPKKPLSGIISCDSVCDAKLISATVKQDTSIDKESSSMVKTEKKGLFITEEAIERNRKTPRYIYLMNTIIGFILLLALIGNIKSVLLTVKT